MNYQEILGDGEVYGAMATLGLVAVAYITPYICYAVRKWSRDRKVQE